MKRNNNLQAKKMKRIFEKCVSNEAPRHLLIFIISTLMVWWFMALRSEWLPEMHFQNKAFGDLGLIFIVLVLFMGAAARLFPFMGRALSWRKELGIWAMILALIHVYIVIDGWVEWRIAELFGYAFYKGRSRWILTDPGFGMANTLGVIALFYGLALLLSSNRFSLHLLAYNSWRYLQQRSAHFLYLLAKI